MPHTVMDCYLSAVLKYSFVLFILLEIRLKFSISATSCEHLLNSESHNFGSGVAELTSYDPETWWTKVNIG